VGMGHEGAITEIHMAFGRKNLKEKDIAFKT
jgi:hypothetical protein